MTETTTQTTLGELMTLLYDEFLAIYDDEELAAVATATTINDLLADKAVSRGSPQAAREADAA